MAQTIEYTKGQTVRFRSQYQDEGIITGKVVRVFVPVSDRSRVRYTIRDEHGGLNAYGSESIVGVA